MAAPLPRNCSQGWSQVNRGNTGSRTIAALVLKVTLEDKDFLTATVRRAAETHCPEP
ncbi:hypothetical protein MPL3365_130591 [Mesorhizobium plurifarium]|uniref:Uncharacterized protein n=1 Tax=Mesorhizobium plurifarium TaxID=69974 RepID=A0A090G3W2_MESPL|nr:hypothetical protein MPL3365_130591 [Mesorhizobium plurifarium]